MTERDISKYIKKMVNNRDYRKAMRYKKDDIRLISKQLSRGIIFFRFQIHDDEWWYREYQVLVGIKDGEYVGGKCGCSYEGMNGSCRHIAAVLNNYKSDIFNVSVNDIVMDLSKVVIEQLRRETPKKSNIVKEELGLDVIFCLEDKGTGVYLKIGNKHKYTLKQKLSRFLNVYQSGEGVVEFGKNLTYESNSYYFSDKNREILELFGDYLFNHNFYEYLIFFDDKWLKKLLLLLNGKSFEIEGRGIYDNIIEDFPFSPVVKRDNNNYVLDFAMDIGKLYKITSDYEYILYNNNIYHLSKKNASLLYKMLIKGIDRLVFNEKDLSKFTNYVIPMIKDKVVISEDIDNIVIVKKPIVKLYFDIGSSGVVCNLKLLYKDKEIDYFSNTRNIVRDREYEGEVIGDLIKENFKVDDKRIYLEGIDNIGYFMEESLPKLVLKYDTFTSKKLQDTNVISKVNINSMFSIGVDNIMNFTFSLDGISNKEIDGIFKSIKEKKRYYKLKDGNILKLDNNREIDEFENLVSDLELTRDNIIDGKVSIPKYRAIYLDSLNNKYNFVKTDNLFDNFIKKFKEYKDISLKLSPKEESILRDYQVTGVKWLYNIHKCDFGGILADEMGLGKSIQVIYFIKKLLKEDSNSKFLIVVPTSLVYNWENEFKKFAPKLRYHIFAKNKHVRHMELESDSPNIYITSYGLLREDYDDYYSKLSFKVCVIDEAQNIKNPTTAISKTVKKINADTKIALTGTPLENSVIELWSIFDFIMPGFLAGLKSFQSKYRVKDFDDDTNDRLGKLNSLISPFILRRRKVDVVRDLPDKIENNIYIDLSTEQKKIYAYEVKRVNEEMQRLIEEEGFDKARFMILQLLTKLRQLCIDPNLIYDDYKGESAKIENLIRVIRDSISNGHKILVFTSFKKALDLVVDELYKNDIRCYTIDGGVSSKKRMELVNKFNDNDDVKVFVITLKSGGTGLNLTGADIVIHLDLWWNPQVENQATDRAHRIGQKKIVEVIKLIAKGTIEEKILELQEKKRILSEKLIEGDTRDVNMISSLTERDIKNLLSYENNGEE